MFAFTFKTISGFPHLSINIHRKFFSSCLFSIRGNRVSLCLKNVYPLRSSSFILYNRCSRSFKTFSSVLNYEDGWGNKRFWQESKKLEWEKVDDRPTYERWREGMRELRSEVRLWQMEMKDKFEADPIFVRPGDMDKIFELNSEEDLKKWVVSTDADTKKGFSTASLTLSPNKCGLFKGYLDTRVPDDGKIKQAGYCNINTMPAVKSFQRDTYYDWSLYTHLTMRIRGDGRSHMIVIGTCGYYDLTWSDIFTYVLFTRGGPYWQDVKIPFSKFLLTSGGRVQDKQSKIPLSKIQRIGFTASDRIASPFYLEIDYIGLLCDPSHKETFAYEMYKTPNFWIT